MRFRRRRGTRGEDADGVGAAGPHDGGSPVSPVVSIDSNSFLEETAVGYTLVDFWAPWCGPCVQFAPAFDALAREYAGRVRFGRLDVDENPDIAALLQIRSIPTLVLFDPEGSEAARFVGIPPRSDLTRTLDDVA